MVRFCAPLSTRSRFSQGFLQADWVILDGLLYLLCGSNILTSLASHVWFHRLRSLNTDVFCHYLSVGFE